MRRWKCGQEAPRCGPGLGKSPSQGAPSLPLGVLPQLADCPTPAAKLARSVGLHPHPAGASNPGRPAHPLRLCHRPLRLRRALPFSRRCAGLPPTRGSPRLGQGTPLLGIRHPFAGGGEAGPGAALRGRRAKGARTAAGAWKQDGGQERFLYPANLWWPRPGRARAARCRTGSADPNPWGQRARRSPSSSLLS